MNNHGFRYLLRLCKAPSTRPTIFLLFVLAVLAASSCRRVVEESVTDYHYYDIQASDTLAAPTLYAITHEEFLQYGADVAYVDSLGDTLIPFGKYAYFGSDTFSYYADVIEHPDDGSYGRRIGIDHLQRILFDLVVFDNGPDYFVEGLTRVKRNGKMGFANKYGEVVIPCIYDYARWFKNGRAQVTFDAVKYYDLDERLRVDSDEWFTIDRAGNTIDSAGLQTD